MNKRGQALIEFVIILPVFIFMIFAALDFGIIINTKNSLENIIGDVVDYYNEGKSYDEITSLLNLKKESINIEIVNTNNEYVEIILYKNKNLVTPGSSLIFDNPYKVSVNRVIYYE